MSLIFQHILSLLSDQKSETMVEDDNKFEDEAVCFLKGIIRNNLNKIYVLTVLPTIILSHHGMLPLSLTIIIIIHFYLVNICWFFILF